MSDLNSPTAGTAAPTTGYATVNGLRMFYEIDHAQPDDDPVPNLMPHGAYMTTADFGPLLPGLAAQRQVVVSDLHGHGRTSHADRPIRYEGMADDAAARLAPGQPQLLVMDC